MYEEYYKHQLKIAADLISGRLKLWMSLYESGKYIMYRTSTIQLIRTIERGLSPTVYGAVLGLDLSSLSGDDFNDRVDDEYGIVWIGDIAEYGDVLCGTLLELVVESTRKKIDEEET